MKNERLIELMSIDTDNLRKKQYDALKDHGIAILRGIINDLENGLLDSIRSKVIYSPAGDGMGCDNHFIDFSWSDAIEATDIMMYINTLEKLKSK